MYVVTIDIEKCEACGDCLDGCPTKALAMVEENRRNYAMYTGEADDCIDCYACEEVCEDGAVTIIEM